MFDFRGLIGDLQREGSAKGFRVFCNEIFRRRMPVSQYFLTPILFYVF